jgi:putative membrane protein
MTLLDVLPKLNAAFNASSGVCIVCGLLAIKRKQRTTHQRFMLAACTASTLFLIGYATRVLMQGTHTFAGHGLVRAVYLAILISHMTLAACVLPLVLRTVFLAQFARRYDSHKRIARITFPIWLYVSVTGVVVYVMLYHFPGYVR